MSAWEDGLSGREAVLAGAEELYELRQRAAGRMAGVRIARANNGMASASCKESEVQRG